MANKVSRKFRVNEGYLITAISLLLMLISALWGILLVLSGAVGTQIAKLHPEVDSTFFSIYNAFSNMGSVFGLLSIGIVLELTGSYLVVFLFIAIISNLGLLGFILLDPKDYETSRKK